MQLITLAMEMDRENIDYDDVFEYHSAEKQNELMDKKEYFVRKTGLKETDRK